MATTATFTGSYAAALAGLNTLSGSETGSASLGKSSAQNFQVSASSPTVEGGGGYSGSFTAVTGGTVCYLSNGTNIVQSGGTGTILPAQGYTVSGAKKLRALYLKNTDSTSIVTVTASTSNTLAGLGWTAGGVMATLQPLGVAMLVFPSGSSTLTSGSNDSVTLTSNTGSPTVDIAAIFG